MQFFHSFDNINKLTKDRRIMIFIRTYLTIIQFEYFQLFEIYEGILESV